jgi:hypothetical protein
MNIDIYINIHIRQSRLKPSHQGSTWIDHGQQLSGRMLPRPDTGSTCTLVCLDGNVRKPVEIG